MKHHNQHEAMITSKTGPEMRGGLHPNHSYVILDLLELSPENRLFLLRNPWSIEGYEGRWSDSDNKWTVEEKK